MYKRPSDTVCVVAVCVWYVANRHAEVDATGRTRDISHRTLSSQNSDRQAVNVAVARSTCGQYSDVLNLNEMKQM